MNEDALRALVREAIARHLESQVAPGFSRGQDGPGLKAGATDPGQSHGELWRGHASHVLLPVASGGEIDGACLIEPAVRCNHCGYCQSVGH